MENTKTIDLPSFDKSKKTKSKELKLIMEERPRLPRTNRVIACAFCATDKTLNPDQYQSYYDFWGSEEKIAQEYMCNDCTVSMKANPIRFWYKHGSLLQDFAKHVKVAFDIFNKSAKGNLEFNAMRSTVLFYTKEAGIIDANVEFVARQQPDNFPEFHAIKLHQIPHVGTINVNPYENTQNRIKIA